MVVWLMNYGKFRVLRVSRVNFYSVKIVQRILQSTDFHENS